MDGRPISNLFEGSKTEPVTHVDFKNRRRLRPEEVAEVEVQSRREFRLGEFFRFGIKAEQLSVLLYAEGIRFLEKAGWEHWTPSQYGFDHEVTNKLVQTMEVARRLERYGTHPDNVGSWMEKDRFDNDMFNCFEMLAGGYDEWVEVDRAIDQLAPQ